MKLKTIFFMSVITISMFFCQNVFAEDNIKVFIDDHSVNFDVAPEIINGRTMVPFRRIFEELGANVEWKAETSEVIAKRLYDGYTTSVNPYLYVTPAYAKLKINEPSIETVVEGEVKTLPLDVAPYIKNGRTLVPLRAVSESFGATVAWDGDTKTVYIYSNNIFKWSKDSNDSSFYYNGNLYFDKQNGDYAYENGYKFEALVWDGLFTVKDFIGRTDYVAFGPEVVAIDKVDNKFIYSEFKYDDSDSDTEPIARSSSLFVSENPDGTERELLAQCEYIDYRVPKGDGMVIDHTEYITTINKHPEWFEIITHNSEKDVGEEINEHSLRTEVFDNGKEYSDSTPFSLSDGRIYNGDNIVTEIPFRIYDNTYISEMETPRYFFIYTECWKTNSNKLKYAGLFVYDKMENKFETIRSYSVDYIGEESNYKDDDTGINNGGRDQITCIVCGGSGTKTCAVCHGSGKVKSYIGGEHYKTCSGCGGMGEKKCAGCKGQGYN